MLELETQWIRFFSLKGKFQDAWLRIATGAGVLAPDASDVTITTDIAPQYAASLARLNGLSVRDLAWEIAPPPISVLRRALYLATLEMAMLQADIATLSEDMPLKRELKRELTATISERVAIPASPKREGARVQAEDKETP